MSEELPPRESLIFTSWNRAFSQIDPEFKLGCPRMIGLDYSSIEASLHHYRSITAGQIAHLKSLLQNSYHPKDSKQNLFVAASTVPITPFPEILYSLLLNIPIICRIPANYSLDFYNYFLSKFDGSLQSQVQFLHWNSKDAETTKAMLSQIDCLIVHGDDSTIKQLSALAEGKRVLAFGHKIAFALYDLAELEGNAEMESLIQALLQDLIPFGQSGCMSPQVVYLLNSNQHQLQSFGKRLNIAIQEAHICCSPAQSFNKQSMLEDALIQDLEVFGNSVILSSSKEFEYSSGGGLIRLKAIDELTELTNCLGKLSQRISCIGHKLTPSSTKQLSNLFPAARLCAPGLMQLPDITYLQPVK